MVSEVVSLGSYTIVTMVLCGQLYGDQNINKVFNIGEWSICGGGRLGPFYNGIAWPIVWDLNINKAWPSF